MEVNFKKYRNKFWLQNMYIKPFLLILSICCLDVFIILHYSYCLVTGHIGLSARYLALSEFISIR